MPYHQIVDMHSCISGKPELYLHYICYCTEGKQDIKFWIYLVTETDFLLSS